MRTVIRDKTIYQAFDTWGEFVTKAETGTVRPNVLITRRSRTNPATAEWDDGAGWDGAVRLARVGWPSGATKAQATLEPLTHHVGARVERIDWQPAVEGGNLDVGRYLEGEPECWLSPQVVLVKGKSPKYLRLIYNGSASGSISSDEIIRRGAVVVALVQLLEYGGHRVRVELVFCSKHVSRIETTITLKDYGESVDVDRLAFAVAHPATLRRLVFSLWEQLPHPWIAHLGIGHGYGNATYITDTGDIYIPQASYGDAERFDESWVIEQLEKQGIHVKAERRS